MDQETPGARDMALIHAQLASIIEYSEDAILSKDLDGIVQTWNRGAERLYGYTAEEMIGQSVSRLMPPDVLDEFPVIMERLRRGQRIEHYDTVRMHKDGRRLHISVSISPMADSHGRLVGASAIARDIGERKRLEAARNESESRFRAMADYAPVMIWIGDAAKGRNWFNRPWLEFTGRSLDEECGSGWLDGIHPDDRDAYLMAFGAAFDARAPFTLDYRLRRHDGEYRWIQDSAVPLTDTMGPFTGYIGSCVDITDRLETTDRITRLQRITAALSEARTPDQMAQLIVRQAVEALGAWAGLVGLVEDSRTFRIVHSLGYERRKMETWERVDLDGPYPVAEAIRTGQPVWVESREDYYRQFPAMAAEMAEQTGSSAAIPLLVDAVPIGAIVLSFTKPQRFDQADREFIQALGHQCAQAMERSRLHEAERRAMASLEAAHRRSAFLADASAMLASSLDYEITLTNVANAVVPDLADWCIVHLLDEDGPPKALVVAHADAEQIAKAREMERRYPPDLRPDCGLGLVLRTGKSMLYSDISQEALARSAQDGEHLRFLHELGLGSALMVPLNARGRTLGAISFLRGRKADRYTAADEALADELARRCAVAVDNARLFKESQELNRAKDEFQAMLAHELRNPIGAISNALLLLDGVGARDPGAGKHVGIASRQLRHVTRLLDDLLDVSRITRGKVQLRLEPVSLTATVDAVASAMRSAVQNRGHRLVVELPREDIRVRGDVDRLEQVFSNLLDNAAKYTPDGGRIGVRVERQGSEAVVRVSDNGIGIASRFLPHIFDLFTQADRSLDRPGGGLGIGLTLVKSLTEMHGGSIAAMSEGPGRGSEFTVRLPVLDEDMTVHPNQTQPSQPQVAESARGRRVLLVEDNVDAAETLTEILEIWGHTVRCALDGPSALEIVSDFQPEIVLLDIGLPGMDGYEVGRRLRASDQRAMLLVAISGYSQPDDRARSRAAGFDVHLPKPVDPVALRGLLACPTHQFPSG